MGTIVLKKPSQFGGVYVILNPITKKAYVGETIDMYRRMVEHIRSICGLEYSSNQNIMEEKIKNFLLFALKYDQYEKRRKKEQKISDWIVDETIYMYLFRKNGFALYNGTENQKDNAGKSREFLLNDNVSREELETGIKEYFGDTYFELQDVIKQNEEKLNEDIIEWFGMDLKELASCKGTDKKIWVKMLKRSKEKGEVIDINKPRKILQVCRELLQAKLSKHDMQICGLKEKSLVDLAKSGELNRVVISIFGHYLDQSPMTILSTKIYDIQHNKQNNDGISKIIPTDRENHGICFWAIKKLPVEHVRKFLSEEETYKGPRYAILPYTKSMNASTLNKFVEGVESKLNRGVDEDMDSFFERMKGYERDDTDNIATQKFARGFSFGDKEKNLSYPAGMFPEMVSKYSNSGNNSSNVALLISELSYAKEYFDAKNLYKYFRSHLKAGYINEVSNTLKGQCSHCCAELKECDVFLKTTECENGNMTGCLVAKLAYPYIIPLVN